MLFDAVYSSNSLKKKGVITKGDPVLLMEVFLEVFKQRLMRKIDSKYPRNNAA
jgi:hypothetical protein